MDKIDLAIFGSALATIKKESNRHGCQKIFSNVYILPAAFMIRNATSLVFCPQIKYPRCFRY